MKPEGVNRVVIAVKDFDKAVALYSELFNSTFYEEGIPIAKSYGIRAATSWDAGIEIVSPLPHSDAAMGRAVANFIEKHGGGVYSVVFSVDDVDEAHTRAKEMGIRVSSLFELDEGRIKRFLQGRFKKFKQYALKAADTCGANLVLGQIEAK